MDVAMWGKALRVIPRLSQEEWRGLDVISKWLVATRSAVLIITFISSAIAGLLALRAGQFNLLLWLLLTVGLIMAHATNNLLNDVTDYVKGVDKDNYFRAQYGPQPLEHGLMTMRQVLLYAAVTGLIALTAGAYLVYLRGTLGFVLLGLGAFFVLFYTWPLKYIGLGELAVLVVWGPLMIGGGYYIITGHWDWNVTIASLPYALGATTVIFGKHIDKCAADKEKRIHTLPALLGERNARYAAIGMMALQYALVVWGPLMIGGGYYIITGHWDWNVTIASLPYALGATTVIFGKHIDKCAADKEKRIHTLPVLLGERNARYAAIGMMALQYALVIYLVAIGYFTPALLIVLLALKTFTLVFAVYRRPKPEQRPDAYPADTWPLWFVAFAFLHNRRFGLLFLLGLIGDLALRRLFL